MSIIKMRESRYWMEVRIRNQGNSSLISGIVDTGAKGTIMTRSILTDLHDITPIRSGVSRSGAVPNVSRLYSEYVVNFEVDGKVLDNVHIFIPEDSNRAVNLIGIDVLSRIDLYQMGNSYRLNYKVPTPSFDSKYVNTSNTARALMSLLEQRRCSGMFNEICRKLPTRVNMSLEEFDSLISMIMREMHMT